MNFDASDQDGGYHTSTMDGSSERRFLNTILPVTIKQLHNAEKPEGDDIFKIDGHDVGLVKVVGQIFNCQTNDNFFSFRVEDGTDSIDGRVWFETDLYNSEKRHEWKEGSYVTIIGQIKSFNEKKSLTAKRIRLVTDYNEIAYHNVESLYVHLHQVKNVA